MSKEPLKIAVAYCGKSTKGEKEGLVARDASEWRTPSPSSGQR
jgi:hypothetical protein